MRRQGNGCWRAEANSDWDFPRCVVSGVNPGKRLRDVREPELLQVMPLALAHGLHVGVGVVVVAAQV